MKAVVVGVDGVGAPGMEGGVMSFRCPACGRALPPARGRPHRYRCGCGEVFQSTGGVPDFTYPRDLAPADERGRRDYDRMAAGYDRGIQWLFHSFGEDETDHRRWMVDRLDLHPGDGALDVGCGTGSDAVHIGRRIGARGRLVAQDLSRGMLAKARRKLQALPCETTYVLGNAAYLPYTDRSFDAAFHFGGLNTYGDRRRALAEMARVVKIGGKVVVGDEAMAPWLRSRRYGRILMTVNPLYRHRPPLHLLPAGAREVRLYWILGQAFYLIEFRVGEGLPTVNWDLPIPGRRGGTLRSRYDGARSRR